MHVYHSGSAGDNTQNILILLKKNSIPINTLNNKVDSSCILGQHAVDCITTYIYNPNYYTILNCTVWVTKTALKKLFKVINIAKN